MRIIPVIDLKRGQVVRGIGGRRDEYQPISSRLVASAAPGDVARAFVEELGLRTVYVADLDAIAGAAPDEASYQQMAAAGAKMWLDAGAGEIAQARVLSAIPHVERVIIGLETLTSTAALESIIQQLTPQRVIFSLDLQQGVPLTEIKPWRAQTPLAIARQVIGCGVTQLIVLDLAHVGSERGPGTIALAQAIRHEFPHVELIGGGGVRNQADLAQLAAAGFDAALVASALHAGTMGTAQVTRCP